MPIASGTLLEKIGQLDLAGRISFHQACLMSLLVGVAVFLPPSQREDGKLQVVCDNRTLLGIGI